MGVARARRLRRGDLRDRVRRDADERARAHQRARLGDGQRVEAQVHAVDARRERHVDPPVHEDARGRAHRAHGVADCAGELVERAPVQVLLADLHPVRAAAHGRGGELRERRARACAVRHEAKDRAAQKLAIPSSGLEAFA